MPATHRYPPPVPAVPNALARGAALRIAAHLAVVGAAVLLGGCERPPSGPLVVVSRLTEQLEGADRAFVGDGCPLDAERRPALGCPRWKSVARLVAPAPSEPRQQRLVPIPRRYDAPRPQILQWTLRAPEQSSDVPRPAAAFGVREPFLRVDPAEIAGPDAVPGTRLTLQARQPVPERVRTAAVNVPPGSVLTFGIGVDPGMPHEDVDEVVFEVAAETPAGERRLFASRLAMRDAASFRWSDHRVSLETVGGSGTRFVFTTRLVPRAGADASRTVALPLWGAPEILAPSRESALNVILISYDTLRADHLGVYGSALATSPHIDRLAVEAVVFDDVFATNSSTTSSHMSMMTGRYPASHGVFFAGLGLKPNVPTLAGVLGAQGWRTGAVTEDGMLRADAGFSRGVSFYRENAAVEGPDEPSYAATATFDAALGWIAAHADERFFLFLHTYVVHWPYVPPAEFDLFTTWRHEGVDQPIASAPAIEQLRHKYAGEARYGDAEFARLRAELARLGLDERTLIVITSDHGEEFGEHHGRSHSRTLYDEVLHVPLIFWAPRRLGVPRRIAGPSSLVDLMPTVLDALGVPTPPDVDGQNLLAANGRDRLRSDRAVFADNRFAEAALVMARTADAKWLWNVPQRRIVEAFDLTADRGEQRPVTDPAFLARGADVLGPYLARGSDVPVAAAGTRPAPDPATVEKLRALGYAD